MRKRITDLSQLATEPSFAKIVLVNRETKRKIVRKRDDILGDSLVDTLIDWRDNDWYAEIEDEMKGGDIK